MIKTEQITSLLPQLNKEECLSWAEIDLAAILHNYKALRHHVHSDTEIFGVVKADAYGHGAVAVSKLLLAAGVRQLCVARVEEAIELRQAGIAAPILVLAPPLEAQALVAAKYELAVVVCASIHISAVAEAQRSTGVDIGVHIKTDVGMGRLGIPPAEVKDLLALCDRLRVPVDGIMAHLPCADAADGTSTIAMVQQFRALAAKIRQDFPGRRMEFHLANSASTMRFSESWLDAVRCGISLYGQFPSVEMERGFDLRPAMTVKSRITFIKNVPAGTAISYGHIYQTKAAARLATVPLGYADGYPRQATNRTKFIVHGKLAPQVGRVCMDQLILDVSDIPEVLTGDEVIAFGVGQGCELRAEDVAAEFDSIGYELTTRIGRRLPRFLVNDEISSAVMPNSTS